MHKATRIPVAIKVSSAWLSLLYLITKISTLFFGIFFDKLLIFVLNFHKVINLFDKDKRHQFYNEFEMLNDSLPQFVSLNLDKFSFNVCDLNLIYLLALQVQYHGVFYNKGMINLVMEYMDCGSLQTIIAVEKAFKSE